MDPGQLPADVLLEIFSYCSYTDLVKFQFVCKWWQQVSREKSLWRGIVYKPAETENTNDILDNLKASPQLEALDLRHVKRCTITKDLVTELVKGCPKMKKLTVFWDVLCKTIHSVMPKIKILILGFNKDDFETFECHIDFTYLHEYFPNVEHLDCSVLILSESDLEVYLKEKGRSLHTVGFRCDLYPLGCIVPYLSVCTALKSLTLYDRYDKNGRLPVHSVGHLKQISSLTLINLGWYNTNDYLSNLEYFPNLVELRIDTCDLYEEKALFVVSENCPLVEKLTLSSVRFGDYTLKFVSNFKKLTFLCLKNNDNVTDACMTQLQAVSGLKYLDIFKCYGLTPQCLFALCSFDQLQILKFDLQNCDPPADLGATHVKNKDLQIMFYNCKDASLLDRLRSDRLRISLLKCKIEC